MSLTTSEDLLVRKQKSVEIWQVIPLILAAALLTVGLAMFLSGTQNLVDVVRPVIVVFGGALAGLMCKLDRNYGAWQKTDQQGLGFSRDLLPAVDVDVAQMQSLFRSGLNVIATGPAGSSRLHGSVTMSRGSDSHRLFSSLPVRRLCLQVLKSIDEATRWAVFEAETARLADRIRAQVTAYLSCLADLGAFEDDRFVVECDAGVRKREQSVDHGFAIFVAFQPRASAQAVSFTVHQTVAGSRVASTAFAPGYQEQ